jgi:hypothetical protein
LARDARERKSLSKAPISRRRRTRVTHGKHLRKHRRGVVGTALSLAAAVAVVAVAAQFVGPAPARAHGDDGGGGGGGGGGTTVREVINIPLLPLTNLCNADVIAFSGDMYITTTTTPDGNGGYYVRTSARAPNLKGDKIGPTEPYYSYVGSDTENAYTYFAPPPQPSSREVAHWTKLTPNAKAPSMFLVVVSRQTVNPNGSVVTVAQRAYLACRPPRK